MKKIKIILSHGRGYEEIMSDDECKDIRLRIDRRWNRMPEALAALPIDVSDNTVGYINIDQILMFFIEDLEEDES